MANMIRNTATVTEKSTIISYHTHCQSMTLAELLSEMNLAVLNGLHKANDRMPIALFAVLCSEIDKRLR